MTFAVIVFPGSNCDQDAYHAATGVLGQHAEYVWHKDADLKGADVVILPGGFAHGDYLRTGAMARFSPVMGAVRAFAARGGPVVGICNGFQVLLEAGLLPGAMLRNRGLQYRCEHVHLRVEQNDTPCTCAARAGQVLRIPIGHGEGNYFAAPDVLDRLEANRQVILRYTDAGGRRDEAANPNGSAHAIAGLCNETRNVVGMMPHPERACEVLLGGTDGRVILDSVVRWVGAREREASAERGAATIAREESAAAPEAFAPARAARHGEREAPTLEREAPTLEREAFPLEREASAERQS